MSDKSNLLEGLVLGGLIGAALALLFAPEGGEKMRETIRTKFRELDMEGIVDRFSEAFEEGKNEAERVMNEGEK